MGSLGASWPFWRRVRPTAWSWPILKQTLSASAVEPLGSTPQTVYQSRLATGELTVDPHQATVITHFQRLHEQLRHYDPDLVGGSRAAFLPTWLWGSGASSSHEVTIPAGVYLWGTVGGGKTMLMDLFYETVEYMDGRKSRVHYHDFMLEVHSLMHEVKKSAPPRDISRWDTYQPFDPIPPVGQAILSRVTLLCLDEFQVTDIADAMILKHLFSYLFAHGLVLVATSNRPPNDLYKNGLQRSNFVPFIEILKRKAEVVSLDPGIDYRRQAMGGGEHLYFISSDPTTDEQLNVNFKFMAAKETDDVRSRVIRIKGRDVPFQKTCGRILDCDFDELCGRALWTNDYIKITQVFHTVYIRNIPILTRKLRSEARRFITLIDTLYDHRIRVIASGEVNYWELFQPEEASEQDRLDENRMLVDDLGIKAADSGSMDASVFSGEEELFAFDRTVSRMTEMQTKDYAKKWAKRHEATSD
ncbi:putative ATPase N2B [Tigriopus californicus]|uniref:putative ATPase N2B n=1 Tax=Tigriopus californicus TaxID=6832 RepID=UPI0027DAB1F8|nr:putative ATPase N2B [Tigriopus californicus]|eukprot:TCALIF_04120-PA protein Name:"Similar to Putative ATPase N2B (Haematobia irritans)" AED:0.32 eAED:0.32 QI:0/-1/0/1/-1/1/1/0/471